MNKLNKCKIKKEIDTFFKKNKLSKIILFMNLKYTMLLFYFLSFLFFILSFIFALIIFHNNKNSKINIIFFILFFLFFIFFIVFIVLSKIKSKKYISFYEEIYNILLKEIYIEWINTELKSLNTKLISINDTWSIEPIVYFNYQKNINQIDNVLILNRNNKLIVNIGTLSQTINIPLNDNKNLVKSGFNPYNVNNYQHFFLTTNIINNKNLKNIKLIPKIKSQKNNHLFNNFYQTDIDLPKLKENIIENIKLTKLIPEITLKNNILVFKFATILSNDIKDNYDSFFNLNFSFNKKILYNNTIELLIKDINKIKLFLIWLNLISYIK